MPVQKFANPTIETCIYRRTESALGENAHCHLLHQISGFEDGQKCTVRRDACDACCQSFPPSLESWNPVIASLLINLLDESTVVQAVPESVAQRSRHLRQKAVECLDVLVSQENVIRPLRVDRKCRHLGPAQPSDSTISPNDTAFRCRHPAHGSTTLERCTRCLDWSYEPAISRTMSIPELVPPNVVRSVARVNDWSVGIVSAPRREATLEWCLDSLRRAGWDRPRLFIDGLIRIPDRYSQLPVTWREESIGAWPNTYLALMEMIQRDPHVDAYLLLQDDAFLYDRGNLREYLEAALWPGDCPGIVSLYCPQPYNRTEPGWHTRSEPWVWGAQAFLFSPAAAREFVSSPEVISHRWTGHYEGRVQVDVLLGKWALAHDWPVWFPNPSLVQHVGNTSSIWQDARIAGFRRANWFAGDLETPFSRETSMTDFPEQLFPCRAEFRDEYDQRVITGRDRMSRQTVVICGLCRNVRHFLPKFAARAERLGSMFRDYRIVLFENDSTDATLEFLTDWQLQDVRVHVLSERLGTIRYQQIRSIERAEWMAEYRNRYLNYAVEQFGEFDYMVAIDTDLAGGWSFDGLANTFGQDDWDFVGSYGLHQRNVDQSSEWLQFDAWAFRAIGHPHPHSNIEVNSMIFDRGEPLLPVLSCFGGMGVYRMLAVQTARYGSPDMEHAELHNHMRRLNFGRLFLNPSQIVLYTPE
ncbi:MAG: hypothetical protein JWM11_4452 [Planctomycetaceae bacterium]|nr:hypothetical protein [Planctomycetaceae bacterium]